MGSIEKRVRTRARKQNIRHAGLSTIGVAGILAVAMAAPNTLKLLKYAPGMRSRYQTRAKRSIDQLIVRGYIHRDVKNMLHLTQSGEGLLARLSAGTSVYKPPEKWDGRWRIVIFDIQESRKTSRDKLRLMLETIGFLKLQASVWIYPHDCEDIINLIKTDFALGKEVLYIVAEDIEGDFVARRYFGLAR